jgi:hypothetical protein
VTAWQQSGCFDGVTCDCCDLHHHESPLIRHTPCRPPRLTTQTTPTFSRGPSSSPCAQNHRSTPISEPARPLGFHRHTATTPRRRSLRLLRPAASPPHPRPGPFITPTSAHAASYLISDSDTRNDVGHGTTPCESDPRPQRHPYPLHLPRVPCRISFIYLGGGAPPESASLAKRVISF